MKTLEEKVDAILNLTEQKKTPGAVKEAIILLNGLKPFLKPPLMKTLKTLTHISESDFDAIYKKIFKIKG